MITYEDNPWYFNDKIFTSGDIKDYVGFVYIIEGPDDMSYLGRKYFYMMRKMKGKNRRQKLESDWKKYYGSNEILKNIVKETGKAHFKRYIISLHTTKGDCNYYEVMLQFKLDVLESNKWYNDNINGKWYKKPQHISEGRAFNETYQDIYRNIIKRRRCES